MIGLLFIGLYIIVAYFVTLIVLLIEIVCLLAIILWWHNFPPLSQVFELDYSGIAETPL